MPTTTKGFRYPSNSAPVAVPADIEALAEDVDTKLVLASGGVYTGAVTFNSNISVPTPTTSLHGTNKAYVDNIKTELKALVALSTNFADFQTRMASW